MLVCIILAQMATAQTSSFTAAKVDAGQECNWPFNAVATNPADNKVYAFWRKGAGAGATYKLIRWDNPGWTTLSTFTTANGTSSSVKVPDFGDAADKVSLAIDKTGRFHVVFKGIALSTVNDGVWYGTSADGVNWSFQPVDILPASAANESLYDAVIEIDKQNQPHVGFRSNTTVTPRTYRLRYFRLIGGNWVGEDAFAQSGSSNGGTVSNEIGQFDLAVDGDAKAHFSFRRETNGTGRDGSLYYVTNTTGSWSSPELLAQGNTAQAQAETNTIDTDANNKVHIVHSDYQNNLYYTTNVSGSFVTSQINGNAKGETYTQHTLQINENGDKFLVYNDDRGSPTRLNYAYQLAGTSGSNWTVGTAFTPNDVARGGNYFSGLMTKDRRIITLFDNSTTDVRGQCKEFQRDLWYATATVQNVPVQQAPTVTTATPASVASTSAILGGNVTADGGASVTERGIVYSASNNPPTTANATKLQIGSATGSFSQTITGLSTSTTYYTRAYAINSAGTSYGATQQFTTTAPLAASISARTNVTCNNGTNGSATLSITGGTAPFTIDWKPGNPAGDGTATITGLSAGSYTAIVTDTYGATAQAIATITQPPALVLSISPSTTTVCGGTVTLTASSTNAVNPSFVWTGTSPTSGPMVTVSSTGTYSVTLTDGSGCKAVASAAVTINPVPNPTIVGLASAYCKNATAVTLTGNPSGGKFTIDSNMATTLDPAVLLVGLMWWSTLTPTAAAVATRLLRTSPSMRCQPSASPVWPALTARTLPQSH